MKRSPVGFGAAIRGRPVGRGAAAAQLACDGAAGLLFPLPNTLDKGLAAHVPAMQVLIGKLPLDHHLGGDAGVVHARLPEGILPRHAMPANQHVLDGEGQRVPHVQAARHIGRRHHDHIGACVGLRIAGKGAAFFPESVVALFHLFRVVCLVQLAHRRNGLS